MQKKKRTKAEEVLLFAFSILVLCLALLVLSGCSGQCSGCRFGCESEEGSYNVAGVSYVSEGCCSSYSCKLAIGELYGDSNDEIKETYYTSCTQNNRGCCSSETNYGGCFIGKGIDCGKFSVTCGSNESENNLKFTDGCVSCEETFGIKGLFYEFIYSLLGL